MTDVEFGPFSADTFAYAASVAHDVAQTTVAAQPSDPFATVSIEPADADASAPGHQAALGVGTTEIAVTVTSEGGGASRTYTVAVERASAPVVTLAAAAEAVAEGAPVRFSAELSAPLGPGAAGAGVGVVGGRVPCGHAAGVGDVRGPVRRPPRWSWRPRTTGWWRATVR